MKGYQQVIDNLVFHSVKSILNNSGDDVWEKLDAIVFTTAKEYNIDPVKVLSDFESALDKKINEYIKVDN
jgi:hypothetical protein